MIRDSPTGQVCEQALKNEHEKNNRTSISCGCRPPAQTISSKDHFHGNGPPTLFGCLNFNDQIERESSNQAPTWSSTLENSLRGTTT